MPPSHCGSILVIDADDATRSEYAVALRPLGRDIIHASDGAEGLGMVLARRPDMIVTDTDLARIDGFSLCEFLRQDHATSNVGILVVTVTTSGREPELARRHGADDVLEKPCAPELLVSAAAQVLQRLSGGGTRRVTSVADAPRQEGSR